MSTNAVEREHGCGFMATIFQRRRGSAVRSLPPVRFNNKREENWSNLAKSLPIKVDEKLTKKPALPCSRPSFSRAQNLAIRNLNAPKRASSSTSSPWPSASPSNGSSSEKVRPQGEVSNGSKAPTRAASGNVIGLGQMGNSEKQPATDNVAIGKIHYRGNFTMGNIVRKSSTETGVLRSANKLDSETLKMMGNEKYKQGKFEEALELYDRAIAMDSSKASYWSNKSAALIGLGRLLDAISGGREAIRIEPSYQRAHLRLASLYIRLGFAEKALQHFKHSGSLAGSTNIAVAQALEACVNRCNEAEKNRDWTALLMETRCALAAGADSAPQIYALQVEALLNLLRHEEAYAAFKSAPSCDIDTYARLFGLDGGVLLYSIQARLYIAVGRFDDAIKAAQSAARLDPTDEEVRALMARARAVAVARSRGNKLFKELNFAEAFNAYSKGLEHEPYNSLLLSNRAACRSKLGQFEKAIEDCSLALRLQPSYNKARLRRADCNAKLERWEASVEDYEMLTREAANSEEVGTALSKTRQKLQHQ
ncbi:hypothetical protein Nepgr_019200 [Nepenthes gracilis]|uniref:Inactive TPR repeat-containing thioredoxin TTL3-like n=1 Tax=Nepenthes gracilis TaxID=150966 RepID=A0AAD3SVF0_NEPGR|nr:hypothetical protein Nepgr_019200 [Nepenthes gracilis]